jgi:hypothetical protein
VRLVFRPIRRAGEELREVTRQPISRHLETYMEMHSFGFPDRPTPEDLPVSVRIAAAAKEIHDRAAILSPVLRRLENLGWDVHTEGDQVVASTPLDPEAGWDVLRRQGIGDQILGLAERSSDLPPARVAVGGGEPPDPYLTEPPPEPDEPTTLSISR